MIKIGDFSKISHVTVKTLRYYDELGLLKPVQVDPSTGYRYYAAAQFSQLQRILALKDLGLSLQLVARLLESDLTASQMVGILRRRKVELRQEVSRQQATLDRIEARLKEFEQENTMTTIDVTIKSIPACWIASVRGVVPTYPEQGELWDQLHTAMQKARNEITPPCFCIDHDSEHKERDHDLEVCYFIPDAIGEKLGEGPLASTQAQIRRLPAEESMASLVHHGPYNGLTRAYQEMLRWLDVNGYQITGPNREIYIYSGNGPVRQDDPSYVSEIQFPVKKL